MTEMPFAVNEISLVVHLKDSMGCVQKTVMFCDARMHEFYPLRILYKKFLCQRKNITVYRFRFDRLTL